MSSPLVTAYQSFLSRLSDHKYLISSLLILAYPAVKYLFYLLTPKPLPGVPYRKGKQVPVLGDAVDIGKYSQKTGTVTDWFDIVSMEMLNEPGNEGKGLCQVMFGLSNASRIVVVTDFREAEDIMARRTAEFDRAHVTMAEFKGITPYGPLSMQTNAVWKHHRRLLGPSMTSKNLAAFLPRANRSAKLLIKLWSEKAEIVKGKSGSGTLEPFDVKRDFMYALTDAIFDITFGESSNCTQNSLDQVTTIPPHRNSLGGYDFDVKDLEFFTSAVYLLQSLPTDSPFPSLVVWLQKFKSVHQAHLRRVTQFLNRKIAEGRQTARERGADKGEMADNVLDLICLKEGGPDSMNDEEVRDELFTFILAGAETTQTTLCTWVKWHSRHPESQKKLRKELLDLGLGDREVTWDDMTAENTPYLSAVVHEALRIANTAGGAIREATKDTTILGHFIPKGTLVYFPIALFNSFPADVLDANVTDDLRSTSSQKSRVTEHLKDWTGDTKEYDPDRWMDEEGKFDANAGPSRPFSVGQRGCFGKALALMELKVFVAHCALAFSFDQVQSELDTNDWTEYVTRMPKQVYIQPRRWGSV